jgi:hypothetical protein
MENSIPSSWINQRFCIDNILCGPADILISYNT